MNEFFYFQLQQVGEEGIQTRMPLNGKIGQCDLVFV